MKKQHVKSLNTKSKKESRINTMDKSNSPASMAPNYFQPLKEQINLRTGSLGLTIDAPVLKTMSGLNIDLSVMYQQAGSYSDVRLFGLPTSWTYKLSYIIYNYITINGTETYVLDPEHPSGMQYYQQKNLQLKFFGEGNYPKLPYDTNQKYAYMLSFLDGSNQYFDPQGKLICNDDKSGNHQLYFYSDSQGYIDSCELVKIVGSEGQIVNVNYTKSQIEVSFPESTNNIIKFSYQISQTLRLASYTDPIGNIIMIEYEGGIVLTNLISKISYPSGKITEYDYDIIQYIYADQTLNKDVVSSIKNSYQGITRFTFYDYNPDGKNHNYLGYPEYSVASGVDALLQSDDNNYRYSTSVNNGITVKTNHYNRLHLELNNEETTLSGAKIQDNQKLYYGEEDYEYFPSFMHLPDNYQYSKEQITQIYNSNGEARTSKIQKEFNDYGQIIKQIDSDQFDGDLKTIKITETDYDKKFGQLLYEEISDYLTDGSISSVPTVTRTENKLTDDGRQILLSCFGTVNSDSFLPEKDTTFAYNDRGFVISKLLTWSDPATKEGVKESGSTFDYVSDHLQGTYTKKTIDYHGNARQKVFDNSTGFLLYDVNEDGSRKFYTYDGLNRLTSQTDEEGAITTFSYNTNENKMTTTYPNGYQKSEYYTGLGDVIKKTDSPGAGKRILYVSMQTMWYSD